MEKLRPYFESLDIDLEAAKTRVEMMIEQKEKCIPKDKNIEKEVIGFDTLKEERDKLKKLLYGLSRTDDVTVETAFSDALSCYSKDGFTDLE